MASRYVLRPCRVLQGTLVPDPKQESLELDWAGLCRFFSPKGDRSQLMKVSNLRRGHFAGLSKHSKTGQTIVFVLVNRDGSGDLRWVLRKDKSFESRLIQSYYVEHAQRDSAVTEVVGLQEAG